MKQFLSRLYMYLLKLKYKIFSDTVNLKGAFVAQQPVLLKGKGKIVFNDNVKIGVINSPMYYNTYAYIEARAKTAQISFGSNTYINNSLSIISEKKISIGSNVLIGYNCSISDSNFHDLNKNNRSNTDPNPEGVIICDKVFIGNNVTILKGVTIGENSVVATGAIVTKSFPNDVIIGGCPAKIIGEVN